MLKRRVTYEPRLLFLLDGFDRFLLALDRLLPELLRTRLPDELREREEELLTLFPEELRLFEELRTRRLLPELRRRELLLRTSDRLFELPLRLLTVLLRPLERVDLIRSLLELCFDLILRSDRLLRMRSVLLKSEDVRVPDLLIPLPRGPLRKLPLVPEVTTKPLPKPWKPNPKPNPNELKPYGAKAKGEHEKQPKKLL